MSWYNTEGKSPCVAIYSRTRFFRNVSGIPFPHRAGEKLTEPYFARIETLLHKNGFHKEQIGRDERIKALSFAEKGFLSSDVHETRCDLYFNEPCSLSVAVGGRDLISISSLLSGRAVTDTRNIASSVEQLLDGELEFAYSEPLGYISSSPDLCGTASEFSTLLFLPATAEHGEIHRLSLFCRRFGAELSPAFVYGNGVAVYTLTSRPSRAIDETAAALAFDALLTKIIDDEISLQRIIFSEKSRIIIDRAWRAFGTLLYARRLDEYDLLTLSSDLRFALSATEDHSKLPPLKVTDLNFLLGECLNASIASRKSAAISAEEIEKDRAEIVSGVVYEASGGHGK